MSEQRTVTLKVIGDRTIHCSGCENTVQFTLSQLPGVESVKADHHTQLIELSTVVEQSDLEDIKAQLEWIGYEVEPA